MKIKKWWRKFKNLKTGWAILVSIFALLFFLVTSIAAALLVSPAILAGADDDLMQTIVGVSLPLILFGSCILAAWWMRKKLDKSVRETLKFKAPNKKVWWMIPAVLFSYISVLIIVFAILQVVNPQAVGQEQDVAEIITGLSGIKLGLMVIGAGVLTPIAEETFFRGLLLSMYNHKLKFLAGVFIGACLFGLAHWQLNVSLDTAVFGIGLGILTWQTESIYPAIGLHMLKNLLAVTFLLLK